MSLLTKALQDIDSWIENSESWHADHIRSHLIHGCGVHPGLEREMIELYSEEYNFQFSEELYELYQWHNGLFWVGDNANPISFVSLDMAVGNIVTEHFPCLPYMPLFTGDECYYVTPEASVGQKTSPIFGFDGFISARESRPRGYFYYDTYAPSITALMQAIAECANTYDGISAHFMCYGGKLQHREIYPNFPKKGSILSPIYDKYGVVGDSSGLWQ
jgi:hypothetical protein